MDKFIKSTKWANSLKDTNNKADQEEIKTRKKFEQLYINKLNLKFKIFPPPHTQITTTTSFRPGFSAEFYQNLRKNKCQFYTTFSEKIKK